MNRSVNQSLGNIRLESDGKVHLFHYSEDDGMSEVVFNCDASEVLRVALFLAMQAGTLSSAEVLPLLGRLM